MQFTGERRNKIYTITVQKGIVRSILVEEENSCKREFYQRGPINMGLIMNKKIFEEAVFAICQKDLISWIGLFDAIWNDKIFGEKLLQKIFERHLHL